MKLLVSGFLTLLLPVSAQAYIPPSAYIVKNIAAKHSILKSGTRVKMDVISLNPDQAELRFKAVLAFDAGSRTLRAWAMDAADRKLYQLERKAPDFTLADVLAFESRAAEIERVLKNSGVPVKTEEELLALPDEPQRLLAESLSLKRYRGTQCWVIGKEAQGHSMLWIEKDSFYPLKFVFAKASENKIAELLFDSYRFQYGFGFPSSTTVIDNEAAPLFREETRDLYVGSVAADFKGTILTGFTEEGAKAGDSLKGLIEQYFKYLR